LFTGEPAAQRVTDEAKTLTSVIASEAKQSIALQRDRWIASSRSLLAMTA
jgi:hypothetical protein